MLIKKALNIFFFRFCWLLIFYLQSFNILVQMVNSMNEFAQFFAVKKKKNQNQLNHENNTTIKHDLRLMYANFTIFSFISNA